jgi:hypothetical protein
MSEIWKEVPGTSGAYEVSSSGIVRSAGLRNGHRGRELKPWLSKSNRPGWVGYKVVSLSLPSGVRKRAVHRLVAEAFIPNPENKSQVNHIDGDTLNNTVQNLEWVTNAENNLHAYRSLGRVAGMKGKRGRHPTSKACVLVRDGYIFCASSTGEAAQRIGASQSNVSRLIRGELKSCKGWRLAE